jgi:hypothetical protein
MREMGGEYCAMDRTAAAAMSFLNLSPSVCLSLYPHVHACVHVVGGEGGGCKCNWGGGGGV